MTGWNFDGQRSYSGCRGPDLSFERPELSPCLATFKDQNDPKYKEALTIIQTGKENLAKLPRGDDVAGFFPCEADQLREKKLAARREAELRNREAIRRGEKAYDR